MILKNYLYTMACSTTKAIMQKNEKSLRKHFHERLAIGYHFFDQQKWDDGYRIFAHLSYTKVRL